MKGGKKKTKSGGATSRMGWLGAVFAAGIAIGYSFSGFAANDSSSLPTSSISPVVESTTTLPVLGNSSALDIRMAVFDGKSGAAVTIPDDISAVSSYARIMHDVPKRVAGAADSPMGAKFRNFRKEDLTMYWDNGTPEGVYSGVIGGNGFSSTNTYVGHTFIFRLDGEELARHTMRDDARLYIIEPREDDVATRQSHEYKFAKKELDFMASYRDKNGFPWLAHWPREKPKLPIWPAESVGLTHTVATSRKYITCSDSSNPECESSAGPNLDLLVLSTAPKVFLIENMLSEFECDHIVQLGKSRVKRSSVGSGKSAYVSNTRTSKTGWLTRHTDRIVDRVFQRMAEVIGVPDEVLNHDQNAENLQIVHYTKGQEYTPHHDFGYTGKPHQRFLTLLVYIDPAPQGGGTSFPKAFKGRGLAVEPPRGSGVLFYSMLGDGNADDKSLHAGMPVIDGEKWLCNLWVWDPKISR